MASEKKKTPAALAKEEKARKRFSEMLVFEEELYTTGVISGDRESGIMRNQSSANALTAQGINSIKYIAGIDEVGRGPLAGPVVAAAVILPRGCEILGIDDSKKLSEKKRNELYDVIIKNAIAYSTALVDNIRIDEINILEATKEAMTMAAEGLDIRPDHILIDALTLNTVCIPQTGIIKGDSKSVSIAAASIVAKVTRDRMMIEYHEKYPFYAFDKNKGYGTSAHYKGIEEHGITPWHRKTFLKNISID